MSIDISKLIDGIEQAKPPRKHPVDLLLDDLAILDGDAYKRLLYALTTPERVSAPSLSNALIGSGADIKPSQVNSWRRKEGYTLTPKGGA